MAMFYGSVRGGRGKATRLGSSSSGLKVTAQSWSGSVIVQFYTSSQHGEGCTISIGQGSTDSGRITLYEGPIKGLFNDSNNFGR